MTPHFTLAEFTASATAKRRGLDNRVPENLLLAALATLQMMERIRAFLSELADREVPIRLTSGYRMPVLNSLVGSSSGSDHLKAAATDWMTACGNGTAFEVASVLAPHVSTLGIGQLIYEFDDWVHTSTNVPAKAINRVLTINRRGIQVGVQR